MKIHKLINILYDEYQSVRGFMGVEVNNVKSVDDLLKNVTDEIFSIQEVIERSDIEKEFGITRQEANKYIKKLKDFIVKYKNDLNYH